jgi:hypothetical protein
VSFDRERPARHPLCTCPELTWDAATGRAPAPDFDVCRARALAGIDPHPAALDAGDLRAIASTVAPRLNMAISTRPQDWAEPAREILMRRGAWRERA